MLQIYDYQTWKENHIIMQSSFFIFTLQAYLCYVIAHQINHGTYQTGSFVTQNIYELALNEIFAFQIASLY